MKFIFKFEEIVQREYQVEADNLMEATISLTENKCILIKEKFISSELIEDPLTGDKMEQFETKRTKK